MADPCISLIEHVNRHQLVRLQQLVHTGPRHAKQLSRQCDAHTQKLVSLTRLAVTPDKIDPLLNEKRFVHARLPREWPTDDGKYRGATSTSMSRIKPQFAVQIPAKAAAISTCMPRDDLYGSA